MDLKDSESLGPILREAGVGRVAAAVIARLGVRQTIQHGFDNDGSETISIAVKTAVSEESFTLRPGGPVGQVPGVRGVSVDAVSIWIRRGERLETRQFLSNDFPGRPDDAEAHVFRTIRSFQPDGSIFEDCAVL
eukprot:CAMPEP_0194342688 /NCGR_PEP_ID=MMETSP0171-20130528/93742_1 /TAXON_ID=218684 /ORGANISM="Corethron pennatum, Strain L29A3" /LENGTH=133 /DNA_ID=CAMNT_0039108549 /DNA_START=246 /DNA_END=643 /DNA_ORIENTATION=-